MKKVKISKMKYKTLWTLLARFGVSLFLFSWVGACNVSSKSKNYNRSIVIVSDVDKIEKHENDLDVYLFINGDSLSKADIRFWKAMSHRDIRTVSFRKYEFRSAVNRDFEDDYVVLKCIEKGSYMDMLYELRVKDEDKYREVLWWWCASGLAFVIFLLIMHNLPCPAKTEKEEDYSSFASIDSFDCDDD